MDVTENDINKYRRFRKQGTVKLYLCNNCFYHFTVFHSSEYARVFPRVNYNYFNFPNVLHNINIVCWLPEIRTTIVVVKNRCAMEKISFLRNHNSAYKLPILFLVLLLLDFFGLKIIHYRFLDYVFLSIIIILAAPAIKVKGTYPSLIMGYCIFVLLSCFYSWIYNRQGLITVIGHSYTYFALLFFFILQRANLSSEDAEKLFVRIALCFCFCYILQYIIAPIVLFSGADDEAKMSVTKYRVRMPGSICGYFLILYAINRYLLDENRKRNKYIFYALIAFVPIIIQGFRSLVMLTILAVFLIIPFVLRNGKKTIIYSILGAVAVLVVSSTSLVQAKVDEMIDRQEQDQTFENEDYIRFRSFDYYWNVQFTKPYEKLIGGGVPSDSKTSYYKNIRHVKDHLRFFGLIWELLV